MYEQHFGLKKRPFRATAGGTNVFVGPQIASTMAGLKKALASNDAIVTVSGPVGSGKTTLVTRALESIGNNSKIVHVGRMCLDSNDVLEFLLDELGVENRPSGTIQKFALFRRRLKELQDDDSRVLIAVEDANHLGADTLAELEALTAADAGDSEGASVVLMGDDNLDGFLKESGLARVRQRIRQRHSIGPLCAAELRGYLRHCFRLAGGDFEQVFEANAAALLHHLSDGIPRISNNLVESAMVAAADQDLSNVPSKLLARVAENEYGLNAAGFDFTQHPLVKPAPVVPAITEPEPVEPKPGPAMEAPPEIVPEPELEAAPWPEPEAAALAEPELEDIPELPVEEPVIVFAEPAAEQADEPQDEDEIPELIQDTLPDLAILSPTLAAAAAELSPESFVEAEPEPILEVEPEPVVEAVQEPVLEVEPEPAQIPELEPVSEPQADFKPTGGDIPAWDRDPTMAELKPDLAALEQAMAFAHGDSPEPVVEDSGPIPEPEPEEPEVIPEITLDHAISQRIANNLIDEKGEVSAPNSENVSTTTSADGESAPVAKSPPKANKQSDTTIEKIAEEIARAKSIEDVDDRMAETLFGDEINFAAAQVLANPPTDHSANDDKNGVAAGEHVPNGTPSPALVPDAAPGIQVTLEAPHQLDSGGMDLSASQRLKTVRALNADLHPSIREPEAVTSTEPTESPGTPPEPIEDQINTSMTQTLKALNVRPPVNDDDMDDGEGKGGFFSRFKRT